jgi:uncharacterized protein
VTFSHPGNSVTATRAAHRGPAPWPYGSLDVAGLRAGGWRPAPFREVVLKVHQRCNLACDYCYVYEQADQSWRDRPVLMSRDIRRAAIDRLARHVRAHDLTAVRVVLHGGEPLLYGAGRLAELAEEIRAGIPSEVELGMQTNGVRLDEPFLEVLRACRIRTGVSVDGTAATHDRHRRTRRGTGSFAAVARALDLLSRPENRAVYAGLLCTVPVDADPVETFEQLTAFDPPAIDLLLPHANWAHPPGPPGRYAHWLATVFDHWYAGPHRHVRVRLFDDALSLLLGGHARGEQLGLDPSAVLVIESDGAIEQVDALKSAYPGAAATGLSVLRDDLDEALTDPGIVARQIGMRALAGECLRCPVRRVCGGGHYAHRYAPGAGFRNPSVYCADLRIFLDHVRHRLTTDVRRLTAAPVPRAR